MILLDTSIWIDHLHRGKPGIDFLLRANRVLIHPFVVGEIALGSLRNRQAVLANLLDLPSATPATDAEALTFIERHKLGGAGIGYVDAHLLAAVSLTSGASLWTADKRLAIVAERLGLARPLDGELKI
jgi:predicted nucleic acid-binding protein